VTSLLVAAALGWLGAAPAPEPRSEVAAAVVEGEIAVIGGLTADGAPSARVDAYSPTRDRWRRLPDLPAAAHHTMAAAGGARLYVVGGYGGALGAGARLRSAFVLDHGTWRSLPPLPQPRAAGGAAVVAGKLYVVGGVGRSGLARQAFALDLKTRRWEQIPAPTPREHLAVTAARGRLYALGGRTRGFETNLRTFEVWTPGTQRWRRLAPLPQARGGTGAAVAAGSIVSVGGEAPSGTIAPVYAYDLARGRWRRLPDLPTPRHGLGVAAIGTRVYALAGGPLPGLTVSSASEYLDLG
jgi:non-specific serine/threonine protein kinase